MSDGEAFLVTVRRHLAAKTFLLTLLLAMPVDAHAQLVVPGRQFGLVKCGMSEDDVIAILGRPNFTDADSTGRVVHDFFRHGVRVVFRSPPVREVDYVYTHLGRRLAPASSRYATDLGIRLGSSGTEVVRAYGRGYRQGGQGLLEETILTYDAIGLSVFIGLKDNRVTELHVNCPK